MSQTQPDLSAIPVLDAVDECDGHAKQAVEPFDGWYVFFGQNKHGASSSDSEPFLYAPGTHGTHDGVRFLARVVEVVGEVVGLVGAGPSAGSLHGEEQRREQRQQLVNHYPID